MYAVCAALAMAACSSGSQVPTSPSATGLSKAGALAITIPTLPDVPISLKASAPVAQTPVPDAVVTETTAQLVVSNPSPTFVPATLQVTYELWKITGGTPTMVFNPTVSLGSGTTSVMTHTLEDLQEYAWRAFASLEGKTGPVSTPFAFRTEFPAPEPEVGVFSGIDDIDPNQIVWLHSDVSNWTVNSMITGIDINESTVCIFHTQAGLWPFSTDVFPVDVGDPPGGAPIEGNIWIMAQFNGVWHAATWDWLRPGQQCKDEGADAFGRDQIRIPPMDASWVPQLGDPTGFMMSTIARTNLRAGEFRTNIVVRPWPY